MDPSEQTRHTPVVYQAKFHDRGWKIAFETPQGLVSLACIPRVADMAKPLIFLGYPKDSTSIPDQQIQDILGVNQSGLDQFRSATAIGMFDFPHGLTLPGIVSEDLDITRELSSSDGIVHAFSTVELKQWARFKGIQGAEGAIWISDSEHKTSYSQLLQIYEMTNEGELKLTTQGSLNSSKFVATYPYNHANQHSTGSPTTDLELVLSYRDKFLDLAREVVQSFGGASSIIINFQQDFSRESFLKIPGSDRTETVSTVRDPIYYDYQVNISHANIDGCSTMFLDHPRAHCDVLKVVNSPQRIQEALSDLEKMKGLLVL